MRKLKQMNSCGMEAEVTPQMPISLVSPLTNLSHDDAQFILPRYTGKQRQCIREKDNGSRRR